MNLEVSTIRRRVAWQEIGLHDPCQDALVYEIDMPVAAREYLAKILGKALDKKTGKAMFVSQFGDLSGFKTPVRLLKHYDCANVAPPADLPPVVNANAVMMALDDLRDNQTRTCREKLSKAGAYFDDNHTQTITVEIKKDSIFEKLVREALDAGTCEDGTIECFPTERLRSEWHHHGVRITPNHTNVGDVDADDIVVVDVHEVISKIEVAAKKAEAKNRLAASPFAGAEDISEDEPYLIQDYVLSRGVSVICGDPEAGKTTLAVDLAAHVAYGLPWQHRATDCRPVVYYALEGDGDVKKRIKATEHTLEGGKGSPWGEGPAPIIVRQRLPETQEEWHTEIDEVAKEFVDVFEARQATGEDLSHIADGDAVEWAAKMVVVVDTFRAAIGGGDERSVAASAFINRCVDLTKDRDSFEGDEGDYHETSNCTVSHVVILHHNQKNTKQYAGGGPIYSNTNAFYYVTRAAKQSGKPRTPIFSIVPDRVKEIELPPALRLRMETVKVPGTTRTTVIVKDASKLPKELRGIREELAKQPDTEDIDRNELNEVIDATGKADAKASAVRMRRKRVLTGLLDACVIEEILDDDCSATYYRLVA